MYLINLLRTTIDTPSGKFIKFHGKEIRHLRTFWVYIKAKDFIENKDNTYEIKNLLEYPKYVQDFLIKGIAPIYVDEETGETRVNYKVYITNSTANSVVFYTMAFLNNNFSLKEIKDLRNEYSFNEYISNFEFEELRESLIKQSSFFLKLYRLLMQNDRFEYFIDNILSDEKFNSLFKTRDRNSIKKNFHRKVYHQYLECQSMREDYHLDETFSFQNTGMFAEKSDLHLTNFYSLDEHYLKKMGMRNCYVCSLP